MLYILDMQVKIDYNTKPYGGGDPTGTFYLRNEKHTKFEILAMTPPPPEKECI